MELFLLYLLFFLTKHNANALVSPTSVVSSYQTHTNYITYNRVDSSITIHFQTIGALPSKCSQRFVKQPTRLNSFLPPSGGKSNNNNNNDNNNAPSELGDVATSLLGFGVVIAFFLSPLGGIFFAIVNSFFAAAIILPVLGIVAFNVWQYFNTISGTCPNCGAPVKVLKDSTPSFCFSCGSILQAKENQIYMANPNNQGDLLSQEFNTKTDDIFASWLGDLGGVRMNPVDEGDLKKTKARSMTVIDVDAERIEKQ